MKRFLFFACIACVAIIFASCDKKDEVSDDAVNEITIYGNVIDRTTGLPLYNVLIQEKNNVGGSTVTGNDGNYEFTLPLNGSSDGKYYLIASKDKYSTSEYELLMSNVDKNRRVKVDFQLTKESITYTGKVVDSNENPIVDAKISATFYYSYDRNIGTTAITDESGSYALELPRPHRYNDNSDIALDQWEYTITASKSGYNNTKHVLNQNADDMGKTITLNFILKSVEDVNKEKQVTISGKVTSGSSYGTALADAYLTVKYLRNGYYNYVGSVMTDSNGKYSISFIPYSSTAYTYYFYMEKEGYEQAQKTLTLSTADAGRSYTLDFILQK